MPESAGRQPRQRPDAFAIVKAIAPSAACVRNGHPDRTTPGGSGTTPRGVAGRLDTFPRQREPLTVFISGRSGEGKTTLVEHS